MNRLATLLVCLLWAATASAQFIPQPYSWTSSLSRNDDGSYTVELKGIASDEGWHTSDIDISFPEQDGLKINGKPTIDLDSSIVRQNITLERPLKALFLDIEWVACGDISCLPPESEHITISLVPGDEAVAERASSKSLWKIILEAIAWGFVALLTPCVFPMVPMTVSFFLKQNEKRKGKWLASIFGLSIVALYTIPIAIIIFVTYVAGGAAVTADIFNFLATHWIPNILFFAIFMVFAASFFGAFEITLPSSIVNGSDAKSNRGGLIGVFFVALTLVLVSFSCTGPIVGSVLIKSTQGEFWEPILAMLAFSIAFALPFTILAFAPSLLKTLPKSGGWLNSTKVVLGFIEVALGFKFLSVADQVYHWGILDREVYLAIWIVVFAMLGFYLLGKIRFKYDSQLEYVSLPRLVLAIIDFAFVVYMIPGMWGAPLKALSGYLPPITTQDFVIEKYSRASSEPTCTIARGLHKYGDILEMPYGIDAYFDYDEARNAAIAESKPLFIDFTGHGCVNCREMESRVWSDPRVLSLLKERFVFCALFADDKTTVAPEDWVTTSEGKVLKTLGKINSYFALQRFNVNAQPYYAILNPETEQFLVPSRGYNLDVEEYIDFLLKALQ